MGFLLFGVFIVILFLSLSLLKIEQNVLGFIFFGFTFTLTFIYLYNSDCFPYLVLLVLRDQVVHVAFSFSEFHLVHA
jgi:hypothetical protein